MLCVVSMPATKWIKALMGSKWHFAKENMIGLLWPLGITDDERSKRVALESRRNFAGTYSETKSIDKMVIQIII